MKTYKSVALIAALFSIAMVASGCSKNNSNQPGAVGIGPGYPGYNGSVLYGAGVAPSGNGGVSISFNGSGVYNNSTEASGGQVTPSPYGVGMYGQPKFCANTYSGQICKEFFNAYAGRNSGVVNLGMGQPGNMVTVNSMYYPGSSIAVAHSMMYGTQGNVSGIVTLSAQLVQQIQANPPAGWPNVIGVAYDIYSNGMGGGVLIYTSPGHGFFLPL